jgi:hypothetical protein
MSGKEQPMNDPRQASIGITPPPVRPAIAPGAPRPLVTPRAGIAAPGIARPPASPPAPPAALKPPQPAHPEKPIALVEDVEDIDEAPPSKIVFGPAVTHRKHDWKRKTAATGAGAVRVKSFHGKLSDQGVEHLDDTINEWLDANPDVEVKFVTSTVGLFEGKIKDLALVLNLWY